VDQLIKLKWPPHGARYAETHLIEEARYALRRIINRHHRVVDEFGLMAESHCI
jgi:hypothetical protein